MARLLLWLMAIRCWLWLPVMLQKYRLQRFAIYLHSAVQKYSPLPT